jgi:hypothetical protein
VVKIIVSLIVLKHVMFVLKIIAKNVLKILNFPNAIYVIIIYAMIVLIHVKNIIIIYAKIVLINA